MSSEKKRMRNEDINVGNVHNGNINMSNNKYRQKSKIVLERENQMKALKQQFPHVDSMIIHDVLSKVRFDITQAKKEILKISQKKHGVVSSKAINNDSNPHKLMRDPLAVNIESESGKELRPDLDKDKCDLVNIQSVVVKTENIEEETVFIKEEIIDDSFDPLCNLNEKGVKVFEFFQNAPFEELKFLNPSPEKGHETAHRIYNLRPFANWSDLKTKLTKYLSCYLISVAHEVFAVQEKIENMLESTKMVASTVKRELLQPHTVIIPPKALSCTLSKTQMDILNWLTVIHREGVNPILNYNEERSGRMVQVIAFITLLKESADSKIRHLPHLLIVPSNIIDSWIKAFNTYCPSLKLFVYNGTKEDRCAHRLKFYKGELYLYDVILTTYTAVVHTADEREVFRSMMTDYIIFDETNVAKNFNIQLYDSLIKTKALRKMLVTGGSLQGNPLELLSVLSFIVPPKFLGDRVITESMLQKAVRGNLLEGQFTTFENKVINDAKAILEPFILENLIGEKSKFYSQNLVEISQPIVIKEENIGIGDEYEEEDQLDTVDYVQFKSSDGKEAEPFIDNVQSTTSKVIKEEPATDSDENSDEEWKKSDSSSNDTSSDSDYSPSLVQRRTASLKRKRQSRGAATSAASTTLTSSRKRKSIDLPLDDDDDDFDNSPLNTTVVNKRPRKSNKNSGPSSSPSTTMNRNRDDVTSGEDEKCAGKSNNKNVNNTIDKDGDDKSESELNIAEAVVKTEVIEFVDVEYQ